MKKIILKTTCVFFMMLGSLQSMQGQISLPDGSNDVEDAPAAPIDGFIAIGIAAGAYLGMKKLKK